MDMNTGHETATNMENDKSQGSMHRHGQRGHHGKVFVFGFDSRRLVGKYGYSELAH